MIYITGDTHNTTDMSNVSSENMKLCCMEQFKKYSDISTMIVLGDFGLPWFDCPVDADGIHPIDHTDRNLLKWYNEKPFITLAVMGNHDNYDMLEKLPEVDMFGGSVLKVCDKIFYLKRGNIYTIENKKFLILGGAKSDDASWRTPHESWWPQEEMTDDEKTRCLNQFKGAKVDYILSHNGPARGIALTDPWFENEAHFALLQEDATVSFNDKIDSVVEYEKWFFGHWHTDLGYENFGESKYVALYRNGVCI